jgi:RHS repeat-associated protein
MSLGPARMGATTLALGAQSVGCGTGAYPAPILALASALKCDVDLIFEYLYNNIDFEPLYGSNKGALGTLLDSRGNSADQATLLVTLLQASGYSQVGYYSYDIFTSGNSVANWLGVPNDGSAILGLLNLGGIPYYDAFIVSGQLVAITIYSFAAAVQIGGTWYLFDPSFKQYANVAGVSNLASTLGYDRTQFLNAVGGTVTGLSISGLDRATLRSKLVEYSNNLIGYIDGTDRTLAVANIVGGRSIVPLSGSPIRIPGGELPVYSSFPDTCPDQATMVECRASVTLTMPGAPSGQAIKLFTDKTYGRRVTVFSVPSGGDFVPTLLVDGAVPACVGGGTCTNTGTPEPLGGDPWEIFTQVKLPNIPEDPACASGVAECRDLAVKPGGSYLVSIGVGRAGRGMPEYHRQLLARVRASGADPLSEASLGEALAVTGYTWLAETSAQQPLTNRLAGDTTHYHASVGIIGQARIQDTSSEGPFLDLPINIFSGAPWSSTGPTVSVGGNSFFVADVAALFSTSMTQGAMESAVLEQLQALVPGMLASSTSKIVDANMNPAHGGYSGATYFADGTTGGGQSNYTNLIRPNLQNYGSADLARIDAAVAGGSQVAIPKNGGVAIGVWSGAGYAEVKTTSTTISIGQIITGGLSGAFAGVPIFDIGIGAEVQFALPSSSGSTQLWINDIPWPGNPQTLDPVDAITGSFIYTHEDLRTGSGDFPYSLPFVRTYLSSAGTKITDPDANAGMGNGWRHNYDLNATVTSDPYVGIGWSQSSALQAATSIAALYVLKDLFSIAPTAQTMTLGEMIALWFTDQLTGNAVLVRKPDTIEQFIALPRSDGATQYAFTPQPGSSVRFSQTAAGQYVYKLKDGVTLNFGSVSLPGALQSLASPNGMSVSLSYTGSKLTQVANSVGRRLTLAYSGDNVASVTDDASHSVSFQYNSDGNLTRYTDPLGFATTFAYDTSGTQDTDGHLTSIVYPFRPGNAFVTNWYDPLGRVVRQADANGSESNYFFAGSRSEQVDPLGNRQVTYQNERGRVLKQVFVLDPGFGTVYYDTEQDDDVVNVSANVYDAADRLIEATTPEGMTTVLAYETAVNPWANNIASITREPKSGSPLSPTTQSFTYDPLWNKPATVTDALGRVTRMSYDAATGNLLSVVADAGNLAATSRFTYNARGRVLTATDPVGTVTAFVYDAKENLIEQHADSDGLNLTTLFGYDAVGNVVAVTDPPGATTRMTWDAARRLLTTTAPAPYDDGPELVRTANTYDADGHLISVTRANGSSPQVVSTSYTNTGKVARVTDANGNVTTNAYDAADRLLSVTDPLLRVTSFGYDAMNRLVSVSNLAIQSDPLEEYAYTPDGQRASFTDANGNATAYAYDGFDRLASATYPDTSTEEYAYDANDNVLTRETRAGDAITFTYDTLDRLARKAAPGQPTVTYGYDLAGRLTAANDNSSAIAAVSGSPASYATTLGYDVLNRATSVGWTPAAAQTTPSAATVTFEHAYDATNRRVGQTTTDDAWWSVPSGASSTAYTANNLNQYTAVGGASPTYDDNGNLSFDGEFTYAYDSENRLLSIADSGTPVASYAYDAQGRRKSRTVGAATTIYVTDADNREVLEYDGSTGAVLRWHSFSLGVDAPLNRMEIAGATRATLIPDIQGSIVAELDASGGALTTTGFQTYGENPSLATAGYHYTARRLDPETTGSTAQPSGLYYYRARIYAPTLGRFAQPDSIGHAGGRNLYAYVSNDPLNLTDARGLSSSPISENRFASLDFVFPGVSGGTIIGSGIRGLAAAAAVPTVIAGAILALTSTPTAMDERITQYVIRGGLATPENLQARTGPVRGFTPLTGFSVTTAPGLSLDDLARYAQYPNGTISYTTVKDLAILGIQVAPTPQPNDPLHATVVVPDPLPNELAGRLSAEFGRKMDNPYMGFGPGRNFSVIGE